MSLKDTLVSQDDFYAHAWDSNFGSSPFDPDHEVCDQQEDTVEYEPTPQPKIYHPPALDNSKNSGGIPAGQPAANDKELQITEKTSSENENHEPIPETSRKSEDIQETLPKIPQNLPKSTQKMTHKKLRKLSTQEAKNITYAQTPTQTTQTHIDTEKTIQETQRLYSNTTASTAVASLTFSFIFFFSSSTKTGKLYLLSSLRRKKPNWAN